MKQNLFAIILVLPFVFAYAQTEKLDKFPADIQEENNFTARQVSEMAIFPGCEHLSNKDKTALQKCFQQNITNLLIDKLADFSAKMEELKISTAITKLQFVVDKKGKLIQIKAMDGGTAELGAASLKAMNEIAEEINPIRPALLADGTPVNLVFQLPIKYQIDLPETVREPEYEWNEVVLATLKDNGIKYEIRASKLYNYSVYEVNSYREIFLGNFSTMGEIATVEPYQSLFRENIKKLLITEGEKEEIRYKFYNTEEEPQSVYVYQFKEGEEILLEKMDYKEFYISAKYSEFFVR